MIQKWKIITLYLYELTVQNNILDQLFNSQILIFMMFVKLNKINTKNLLIFTAFSTLKNHYEVLDLAESASFKEIKEKYHAKSKLYHPDVSKNHQDIYREIQQAYRTLSNSESRKKYDLSLGIRSSAWEKDQAGIFKHSFQEEGVYQQILKTKTKQKSTTESIQQILQRQHKCSIQNFKYSELLFSFGFMSSMITLGLFWVGWNTLQKVLLNYKGDRLHETEMMSTEASLKIVPLITR